MAAVSPAGPEPMTITRSIADLFDSAERFPVAAGGTRRASNLRRMPTAQLPLEDTFGDIVKKAMRGNGVSNAQLAGATGIAPATIAQWLNDEGAANDDQARAVARVLHLDGAKLADSAAQRWQPPAIELPEVRRHPQAPHPSNGYVFF